jgi:hypothetical protein
VSDLEAMLCSAYGEEVALYTQALALAEQIAPALHRGEKADVLLQPLVGLLAEVGRVETRITDAKARWHQSGMNPGDELRAVLSRLEALLRTVHGHVGEAAQEAQRQQARLTPALDGLIRGRLMRRAYRSPHTIS